MESNFLSNPRRESSSAGRTPSPSLHDTTAPPLDLSHLTKEQLHADFMAESALLHRLSAAAKELVDYAWVNVPYSDGEFIKLLRVAGEITAEVRKNVYVPVKTAL